MTAVDLDEIIIGRRAWSKSQELLAAPPTAVVPRVVQCAWYGTNVHTERGAFALVRSDSDLINLVGDILKIIYGKRTIYVYCLGSSSDLIYDFGLTRRGFAALDLLSKEYINVTLETVE